ncbi:hypothetical protein EB796_018949 [Bugula neritina]|uniref:PD-(D/E)XK endonuclease-like domain-containing protein n=1 Tax=Bugula neritina TaxID=10212 RepID=A0A7J7JAT6_BUGNE|nr:hypothetical protein EB796_018949 [Bugula neritina]
MILKLGLSGFEEYQKGLFRRGSALHSNIENHLLGRSYESTSEILGYMHSVEPQLQNFHDVVACETKLNHDVLRYTGVIDCVAHHRKTGLYIIDWKTSERKKTTLSQVYDNPIQVAAYIGMWNNQNPDNKSLAVDELAIVSLSVKQDRNHQLFSAHNYVVKYIGYLKTFHLVK